MDSCGSGAYKNGRTFDQCRQEAREKADALAGEIGEHGQVSWSRILEAAGHDELVYKLTLKYLREKGYDIGNHEAPRVMRKTSCFSSRPDGAQARGTAPLSTPRSG